MPYPAPVPCLFPYCLRKQMHRTLSDVLSAHRTHGHSHVSYSHLDEIVDICASHDGLLKVLLLPGLHFLQFFHSFRFPAPCTAFLSSTMRHVLQQPHCVFCSAMRGAFQLRIVQCFSAAQCAVLFNCAMCSAFQLHISYLLPRNLLQNPLAVNRNPPVPLYAFPITGYNFF